MRDLCSCLCINESLCYNWCELVVHFEMITYHFCLMQIKLSSVQLARKYMKRVSTELEAMSTPEKEPNREFLLLQGVRFAFRVHQVMLLCSFLPLFFYLVCFKI